MDQIVDAQTCRCDVLVITRVPSPLVCYLARRGLTSKKDQRFKAISKERADNNTGGPALLSCSETRTITKAHPLETFSSILILATLLSKEKIESNDLRTSFTIIQRAPKGGLLFAKLVWKQSSIPLLETNRLPMRKVSAQIMQED